MTDDAAWDGAQPSSSSGTISVVSASKVTGTPPGPSMVQCERPLVPLRTSRTCVMKYGKFS